MHSSTRRVEFRDTDTAGIAHFSAFLVWMEQVEHEFLRSRGLSVFIQDEQGPISWPRVHVECDYHSSVKFEDVLDIALSIERLGRSSISYLAEFSHQGRRVATGKITSVCCRLRGDAPPQSIAIPDWIRAKLTDPA